MQAPKFWYRSRSWQAVLLSPFGALYAWATARRQKNARPTRVDIPVICIGNLNVGGTGKTPTTIALAQLLSARGIAVHIVSRGYGGSLLAVTQVDPRIHTADETGDEPLLMAAFAPTWVANERVAAARAAQNAGADVILLDDGFQDPSLTKDLTIIVVDAARGFGNGCCLPAGPLRESVHVGLKRANAVISIGEAEEQSKFREKYTNRVCCIKHLSASLKPIEMGMPWAKGRYLAFAGIGDPEKFFATLRGLGAPLVRTVALDDHQKLARPMIQRLMKEAQSMNAQLVTTEKDAARLPADLRSGILSLPVRLEFDDANALETLLEPVLSVISDQANRP
jgi:tetraacyldisaccharide 4'-kinase